MNIIYLWIQDQLFGGRLFGEFFVLVFILESLEGILMAKLSIELQAKPQAFIFSLTSDGKGNKIA